jgi:hypothetical protein
LLYIKCHIVACNISDRTKGLCETVWASIRTEQNEELTIGVYYRYPLADQAYEENLVEEITQFAKSGMMVMGDFNHGDIDWDCLQAEKVSSRYFMNKVQDLFMTQWVEEPTRGENVLDLVLTTEQDRIEDL